MFYLLVEKGKKKQIMGTFTITLSGSFLTMQPIFKGTTNRYLSKGVDFPADFDVTCTANHCNNGSKAIKYLEKIVFLYAKKKERGNLPLDVIFDVFKKHII